MFPKVHNTACESRYAPTQLVGRIVHCVGVWFHAADSTQEIAPRHAIAPRPRLFPAGKLDESIPTSD